MTILEKKIIYNFYLPLPYLIEYVDSKSHTDSVKYHFKRLVLA